MGCIYMVTCLNNGKKYIGKTIHDLNIRKNSHLYKAKSKKCKYAFHNAIKKYGEDSFVWEPIFYSNDEEELYKMEVEFIYKFKTIVPNGYNLSAGGEGVRYTDQVRINYRIGILKRNANPEYIKRVSDANKKRKWDLDSRKKMSDLVSKLMLNPENIKTISDTMKAHHADPDFRAKYLFGFKNRSMEYLPELARKNRERLARPVICLTTGETFITIKQASIKTGCNESNISSVCKGKRKTVGGTGNIKYVFRYCDTAKEE